MSAKQKIIGLNGRELFNELRAWFRTPAGTDIADAQAQTLTAILPNLFGYHIVQLGTHVRESLVGSSRISHTIVARDEFDRHSAANLASRLDALPFTPNAIDVLLVPHVLEFSPDPHAVLREAERVLIGEGYIVLTGFNPWSFCGLWLLIARWRGKPPWCGRFITASRMIDWLQLLGFEIEFVNKIGFKPPLRRANLARRLGFLESVGRFLWPFFGNVTVIVAKKHVAAVTPLKASWKTRRTVIAAGVAEPTRRHENGSHPPGGPSHE